MAAERLATCGTSPRTPRRPPAGRLAEKARRYEREILWGSAVPALGALLARAAPPDRRQRRSIGAPWHAAARRARRRVGGCCSTRSSSASSLAHGTTLCRSLAWREPAILRRAHTQGVGRDPGSGSRIGIALAALGILVAPSSSTCWGVSRARRPYAVTLPARQPARAPFDGHRPRGHGRRCGSKDYPVDPLLATGIAALADGASTLGARLSRSASAWRVPHSGTVICRDRGRSLVGARSWRRGAGRHQGTATAWTVRASFAAAAAANVPPFAHAPVSSAHRVRRRCRRSWPPPRGTSRSPATRSPLFTPAGSLLCDAAGVVPRSLSRKLMVGHAPGRLRPCRGASGRVGEPSPGDWAVGSAIAPAVVVALAPRSTSRLSTEGTRGPRAAAAGAVVVAASEPVGALALRPGRRGP